MHGTVSGRMPYLQFLHAILHVADKFPEVIVNKTRVKCPINVQRKTCKKKSRRFYVKDEASCCHVTDIKGTG